MWRFSTKLTNSGLANWEFSSLYKDPLAPIISYLIHDSVKHLSLPCVLETLGFPCIHHLNLVLHLGRSPSLSNIQPIVLLAFSHFSLAFGSRRRLHHIIYIVAQYFSLVLIDQALVFFQGFPQCVYACTFSLCMQVVCYLLQVNSTQKICVSQQHKMLQKMMTKYFNVLTEAPICSRTSYRLMLEQWQA